MRADRFPQPRRAAVDRPRRLAAGTALQEGEQRQVFVATHRIADLADEDFDSFAVRPRPVERYSDQPVAHEEPRDNVFRNRHGRLPLIVRP
ncbi:hypothetical protein D3C72_2088940 [compost metagenome]